MRLFSVSWALMALSFSLHSYSSNAGEVIKIVSDFPMGGSLTDLGQAMQNGIRMGIETVNGKVGEFEIQYVAMDDSVASHDGWDPAQVAQNAQSAIADPDVMVWIGPLNSGAAKLVMPILNEANLAMISQSVTNPGLTKEGMGRQGEPAIYRKSGTVNFFRVVPTDEIQGEVSAQWIREYVLEQRRARGDLSDAPVRVFLLHDGEVYGQGIIKYLEKIAPSYGIEVVSAPEKVVRTSGNQNAMVTKMRALNPEAIYFGGITQGPLQPLLMSMRTYGMRDMPIFLPDGCKDSSLFTMFHNSPADFLAGKTFITSPGLPADQLGERGRGFAEEYKKRFNIDPPEYATLAYEATLVALDAIKRAGKKDRLTILKEIAKTQDFDGMLNRWSFDANGDTTLKTFSKWGIAPDQNGELNFIPIQ